MEFKTEMEIINDCRLMIENFKLASATDLIPHHVMSHGYMSWTMLLYRTFPSLSQPEPTKKEFQHFCDVLFSDNKLSPDEQKYLRKEGWKAFLDD
jgi:hypothetical protein